MHMATVSDSAWEKYVDEASGSAYYYNAHTGESSWQVPADLIPSLRMSDVSQVDKAAKWRKFVDDASGATYYYDEVNGISLWAEPDDRLSKECVEEGEEHKSQDDRGRETNHPNKEQQREEMIVVPDPEVQRKNEKKTIEHKETEEMTDYLSSGDDKAQNNENETEDVEEDNETAAAAAQPWVKYVDAASNKPYYFDRSTGTTQWEKPEGFDESAQAAVLPTGPHVSAEYQAHLNRVRTERLARVTQQVLDPSGNLSKLNTILSGIDNNVPFATTIGDGEVAADAPRTATAEWQQHIDAQTQRYYYHNVVTGATQWNKPDAPIVSGLANWIPPEVPKSESTGKAKVVSGVSYVARAKFNRLSGKYEQLGGDDYWQNAGIASDRAGRQMSHFFDMSELEKNREEALRRRERLKRKNIDWKKIMTEKKAKKQKQKNEWLFTE